MVVCLFIGMERAIVIEVMLMVKVIKVPVVRAIGISIMFRCTKQISHTFAG